MALEALILDVDGTLFDANEQHARAWEQAMTEFGYALPAERIILEIGRSGERLLRSLLGDKVNEEEGQALRDAHGERYRELIAEEGVRLFDGVEELFEEAKRRGLKTAVATASSEEDFDDKLEKAGFDLREYADVTVTDSDVDQGKPDPDTVSAAVEKLGLAPTQCVMVGDTPYDAIAARRAGVACIGVYPGAHDMESMHRAGARVTYPDLSTLVGNLDEALEMAAPEGTSLTAEELDEAMDQALQEAQRALSEGERPIGSVLLGSDGQVLAREHSRARRQDSAVAHAALLALGQAESERVGSASGLVLVSTVEPCVMCLGAAMEAGVDTVVYGLADASNGGSERCTPPENGFMPRLVGGVKAEASRELLAEWLEMHAGDKITAELDGMRGEE